MAFRFGKSEQRVKASNVAEQSMVKWPYKFLAYVLTPRSQDTELNSTKI